MRKKFKTSIMLSADTKRMSEKLSDLKGISISRAIEEAIIEKSDREFGKYSFDTKIAVPEGTDIAALTKSILDMVASLYEKVSAK